MFRGGALGIPYNSLLIVFIWNSFLIHFPMAQIFSLHMRCVFLWGDLTGCLTEFQ